MSSLRRGQPAGDSVVILRRLSAAVLDHILQHISYGLPRDSGGLELCHHPLSEVRKVLLSRCAIDSEVKPDYCEPEAKYEVLPLEELPVSYGNEALLQFEGTIPEEKLFCVRRAVAIHPFLENLSYDYQPSCKIWRLFQKGKPFSSEYIELYEKNEAAILSSDATFPAMVMLKADILRQRGRFDECIEYIDKHSSKLGHFLIDRCLPVEDYLANPEKPIPSLQECLANVPINECKGYRSLLNKIKKLAGRKNIDVVKHAEDSWIVR